MEIHTTRSGNTSIIALDGQFSYGDDKRLTDLTVRCADEGATVIAVDVSRLNYLSSSGIAAILGMLKAADEKKSEFVLFGMNQKVTLIMEKVFSHDFVPLLTEEEFKRKYL